MKNNIIFYFFVFFIGLIFVITIKGPVVNFLGNLGSVGLNEDVTLLADGQYTLAKTSPHFVLLIDNEADNYIIEPTIVAFNFDENFIIAKTIATPFDYTKNKDYECYWIVDIYQKKVYTYLEKNEFLKKKDEFSINLYLKNINEFF